MKSILALAAIVLAACSSSSPATKPQKARIPEPEFEIRQLVGPPELNYPQGSTEVKFRLDIGNHADVAITLSRVELVTVNPPGGAYTLDRRAYYFRKTIDPHQSVAVEFWARATGYGQGRRDTEPVTIRGLLYFETPDGYLRHVFVKEIGQHAGDNN